jgi:hypothetical protein
MRLRHHFLSLVTTTLILLVFELTSVDRKLPQKRVATVLEVKRA